MAIDLATSDNEEHSDENFEIPDEDVELSGMLPTFFISHMLTYCTSSDLVGEVKDLEPSVKQYEGRCIMVFGIPVVNEERLPRLKSVSIAWKSDSIFTSDLGADQAVRSDESHPQCLLPHGGRIHEGRSFTRRPC